MTVTRIMWYAGTMLTALALLAASATSLAPDQTPTPHGRSDGSSVANAGALLTPSTPR